MYVIKSNRKKNSYTVRKINRVTQVVRVGRRGIQGPTGPQGPKGDPGDPATNLVQSVNGKQGVVVLNATDVGADPTGSASQALQDAKDYTDTKVSTLDSSLATVAKTGSYNDLSNKPTIPSIAGLATEAQVQDVQDNLDAHEADTANPHAVTKAQVGLGNVDNLAPADMPVSTATQTALNAKANASDTVNLTGNQTVAGVKTLSSSPVVPTATTGTQAVNKAQMDAADALKLNISDNRVELRGTGFPQGVVSAPVGTTYVDTAATNGAIEWKKATGTGNTGWVVSVGDTGWRNITSLASSEFAVVNPNDYGYYVRRVNNEVQINIKAQTATASWTGQAVPIPDGFRVINATTPVSMAEALQTAGTGRGQIQVGLNLILVSATWSTSGVRFTYNLVTTTTNTWPATLPGVSV